jgi:DnaK suppressor protein
MSPERQAYFRGKLLGLQADIKDDLNAGKSASDAVELDTAIGRLSRMDAKQDQQMALGLRRRQELQLQRITKALERVKNGTYGQCVRCRKPIAEERLELAPDVFLCVRCA